MSELNDLVVLITGAGRGLGCLLAREFATQGAIVAANDLTPVNVKEVVAEITAASGRAKSYLADVAKKVAVQVAVTDVIADWGRIDVLVNHACVHPHAPLLDMDEWDWHRVLDVNLTGAFLMTQSVGRVMRDLGGGAIVNIGPKTAQQDSASPINAAFAASKAGLLEFTRRAAGELSAYNIRVNAICPGADSPFSAVEQVLDLCRPDNTLTGQLLDCV